jgi:alanine racemase
MLYGYHTLPNAVAAPALKPVLSLRTTVAQLRTVPPGQTISYHGTFRTRTTSRIAILPIGYADGISRHLSNRGCVLVRGRRAPIVGLICMDMMMVDVSAITDVAVGDEVVLIGRQGSDQITAHEVAQWASTIPYEVLCAIGPRIPRQYLSD